MTCAHIAASKGSVAVIKELMRFNKITVITARNKVRDRSVLVRVFYLQRNHDKFGQPCTCTVVTFPEVEI